MRCVVTGGTGFVGSHLVNALVLRGDEVLYCGTPKENVVVMGRRLPRDFTAIPWGDIGPVDVLFHQAAITDTLETDREKMYKANYHDALYLFQKAVVEGSCKRIVYASSCAVYGDAPAPFAEDGMKYPLNVYAASKWSLDISAAAFNAVGLRYGNVYGPSEAHKGKAASMVTQLAEQMKAGKRPRIYANGEHARDFVYVKDVVRANLLAADSDCRGAHNVGTGQAVSFNEVVATLNRVLWTDLQPKYTENPHPAAYQNMTCVDPAKSQRDLGFVAEWSIAAGISDYLGRAT